MIMKNTVPRIGKHESVSNDSILKFIRQLPKTEIHLHIEAAVTTESYRRLNEKYRINSDLKTTADYQNLLDIRSLSDMIKYFLYFQTFFRSQDDFLLITEDLGKYAQNNNIYYLEAFFSPSMIVREGRISFDDALSAILAGLDAIQEKFGVDVRIIVDVSRSFGYENARNNYTLLKSFLAKKTTSRVLGIGLGGSESGNSCVPYKSIFLDAKADGMMVVAHAGEEVDSKSIWDAVNELKVMRIGHGTSAIYDDRLMKYLAEKQIPLEICPTSNVITQKYVSRYSEHPIRKFLSKGIQVSLNTDDPVLFDINLNREYRNMHQFLNFTKKEILSLVKSSLFSTFLSTKEKNTHWNRVKKAVKI